MVQNVPRDGPIQGTMMLSVHATTSIVVAELWSINSWEPCARQGPAIKESRRLLLKVFVALSSNQFPKELQKPHISTSGRLGKRRSEERRLDVPSRRWMQVMPVMEKDFFHVVRGRKGTP